VKNHGDVLAVLVATMLLLLTAWGSALAMAVISGVGSVIALAVLTSRAPGWIVFGRRLLGMIIAIAAAAAIAFAIEMIRSHNH
jgi:hypothetical protein